MGGRWIIREGHEGGEEGMEGVGGESIGVARTVVPA